MSWKEAKGMLLDRVRVAGATCGIGLSVQTLWQAAGHSITLLQTGMPEEDEQGDYDDADERFGRLDDR
jgi:hypothetical protein